MKREYENNSNNSIINNFITRIFEEYIGEKFECICIFK